MSFKVGDTVWYAHLDSVKRHTACPDCFGKKALTVILGDDSSVSIDCAGCAKGYDPPRGYVSYWQHLPAVCQTVVTRVEETTKGVEYGVEGNYSTPNIFATREDAEICAHELAASRDREELERINQKEKHNRTWAWHVTYHRRGIKEAQRQLEYHTKKLAIAKEKAKQPESAS